MDVAAPGYGATGFLSASTAGLVLLDAQNHLVYHNSQALRILAYAGVGKNGESLNQAVGGLLFSARASRGTGRVPDFKSGRRRYSCRWFVLSHSSGIPERAVRGVLLERITPSRVDLSAAARHFGLTQREQQTVEFLTLGLTSKEIASRMNISPNTVKAFFRLVMTKMVVNTRSGIVGKITQTQSLANAAAAD